MTKKELIYQAVRDGAATYRQAADAVGCHDTYVHELAHKDQWLYSQILRNKANAKVQRAKRIVEVVGNQKREGVTWSRMKSRCGYSQTQWQRARQLVGECC